MSGNGPSDAFEEINSEELLADLLSGGGTGQKAFARLVRITHNRFLGFIQRHLASPEECREVLQETYLAVHKGLPGFAGKSKLSTWVYSLAHHKICDRLADRDRRHQELTETHEGALTTEANQADRLAPVTAWDAAPDRVAARSAVETLIGKAIEALPPQARLVYQLRDVEDLSGEEAAVLMGITPENVRVQLHRARRQIVDWVQEKLSRVGTER